MQNKLLNMILTLFNIGKIRFGPGTIASFLTLLFWYFVTFEFLFKFVLFLVNTFEENFARNGGPKGCRNSKQIF